MHNLVSTSTSGFGRTVYAPDPISPGIIGRRATYTNMVMSVTLMPDEQVEWSWAYAPDGGRYVSGYTIHKRGKLVEGNETQTRA